MDHNIYNVNNYEQNQNNSIFETIEYRNNLKNLEVDKFKNFESDRNFDRILDLISIKNIGPSKDYRYFI